MNCLCVERRNKGIWPQKYFIQHYLQINGSLERHEVLSNFQLSSGLAGKVTL
jgi:hypothetical protein